MMSGALVAAGFSSGWRDSDEGDDDGGVTSSPDGAVRVPLSWGGWSWSTFGLRWVGDLGGISAANACGGYRYPINVGLNTPGDRDRRVQTFGQSVQSRTRPFCGQKSVGTATFALETRNNK